MPGDPLGFMRLIRVGILQFPLLEFYNFFCSKVLEILIFVAPLKTLKKVVTKGGCSGDIGATTVVVAMVVVVAAAMTMMITAVEKLPSRTCYCSAKP